MSQPVHDARFWDQRYAAAEFIFGTEANDFLRATAGRLPAGPVLCLGEGEGRNAVYLARLGHSVTAVDQSATGLAKAAALASRHGVSLAATVADLADYTITPGAWSAVVVIFLHLPPDLRRAVLARAAAGLRPGGKIVLECYNPAQLGRGTGGPQDPALFPNLAELRTELAGLEFLHAAELERDVVEGSGHSGRASVVQVLARRPFRGRAGVG